MKPNYVFVLLLFIFWGSTTVAQNLRERKKTIEKTTKKSIDSLISIQQILLRPTSIMGQGANPADVQTDNFLLSEKIRNLKDHSLLVYRHDELDTLLLTNKDSLFVTPINYNKIIQSKFRTLSGTEIKNGKYFGTSVAVDAKSMTVNFSVKPFKSFEFYLLPTASAASSNSFVTIFTGDKYSRTVTGGVNFIMLSGNNKSKFDPKTRNQLHNNLKVLKGSYENIKPNKDSIFYQKTLSELDTLIKRSYHFINRYYNQTINSSEVSKSKIADLTRYKANVDTLTKVKLLPKEFTALDSAKQDTLVKSSLIQPINQIVLSNYLDEADKTQQKAGFSAQKIHWFGGGFKYNQGNYYVSDPLSAKLERSIMDEYISANLSYTKMWLYSSGNHIYISPTINFQNNHNFNSGDQIHAQQFQNYTIGATTVQNIVKDITFYPSVPDRLETSYIVIPFAYYNTKWGFGAELDYKYGYHDVNDDNRNVSFGLLIPIQGDKSVVVIEPLVKAQKLNLPVTAFWTNNFVAGINVSVSIPKSFFN